MSMRPVKNLNRGKAPKAKKPPGKNPFPEMLHFDNAGFDGSRKIRITKAFPCVTSKGKITVPAGFVCDGASVPQAAQAIIGHPFDEYLEAGVLHDFLYAHASDKYRITREEADGIFKEVMWNYRVPKWKIPLMFAAVRMFGGKFWKWQ